MAIVDYNNPKDLPAKDYNPADVPKYVADRSEGVREAKYGAQNKEFIAQAMDKTAIWADEVKQMAEGTQQQQDALQQYNDAMTLEMTGKDVISAPELIEARKGEEKLSTRLNKDFEVLNEEISERGFNLDSLVGEDGIITTAMFNEAVASRQNTIFLKKNRTYFINDTITLGHNILEGNNAVIVANNCDGFHVSNGDYVDVVPRIQNLRLKYEGSGSHRGIVASRNWWGGRIRVDNVRINDFSIGVLGMDIYHSTFRDVWISGCRIGLVIKNGNDLSNMNDVSQVDFRDCTYGMYIHEAETMRVFSTTFQECVYGLVIGDARGNVEFDNCYFERNDYNTTLGTIDIETFVLSEYDSRLYGVFGSGVNFSGSTVVLALSPPYFFGEKHKFISRHGNYDTNRYSDNIDNLFTSGIEYENILQDSWAIYKGASDTGVITRQLTDTQYGKKYVAQIDGATGTNIRAVTNAMKPLVSGRTYLIKAKIWATEAGLLEFNVIRDNADIIATGRSFTTVKGGWVDVSTMVTMSTTVGVGSTQQIMIKFPTTSEASKFLITDMMMVDLTTLFGSDNTPGHYMSREISKYFNWAPTGQRVKTGYGSVEVKSFTTTNRPKHPIRGETMFDTTLSKPIWCSVEAVMDTSGVITSAAKWVDSSGATT